MPPHFPIDPRPAHSAQRPVAMAVELELAAPKALDALEVASAEELPWPSRPDPELEMAVASELELPAGGGEQRAAGGGG